MVRRIIEIDRDKCNGCGACAHACHEGAIGMVDGKAQLLRDDYCDGLGDCLPACPTGAITFTERETVPYNEAAVQASSLRQWPVQIKLVPIKAPWLDGADLLLAADCTAYAYANFHKDFMKGRVTLVGCPKLDGVDYAVKLAEIFRHNRIRSVMLTRMEVPCCGGLEFALKRAIQESGTNVPYEVITISTEGQIL